MLKKIGTFFLDFLETIVVGASIFVVIYLFLMQPHEVKGDSMLPNFHSGEYILTDKISYKFNTPNRGDVIVFESPENPDIDYIKRVIALPGETVRIEAGVVYVNGQKLAEAYEPDKTTILGNGFMSEGLDITVAEGHYFVLGDNRFHSSDSREFGPVDEAKIVGRAFFRYWPPQRLGKLATISYSSEN
ncbi:signal peptidase I [Candidatus Gottesmanbacteria bacterium]|nr:signal peptidase I [Candidatus Gottesmanbacteria bacterium]